MNERKEKVILFRIIVDQESGGFPHASNFITKVFNKEPVTARDVRGISSKLIPGDRNSTEVRARLLMQGGDFLPIAKPEKLYQGIQGAVCEFGMMIEDEYLQDALSIQPFVLMKLYFRKEKIYAVIQGKSTHFFPMNYFLSDVMQRKELKGSIYYFQKDTKMWFPLDGNKEGKSIAAFYPIQVVDRNMLQFLSDDLKSVWVNGEYSAEETLSKLIAGNKKIWSTAPEEFRGLLKKLSEIKFADTLEIDKTVSFVVKESTLAFLVFAFSVRSMKEKGKPVVFHSFQQFKNYYQLVNDYAAGVLQLIENIVFHANSHSGVFSMRLHGAKREGYLQKKFPEASEASYLEISVADYQGSNTCDNIASNFVKHVRENEKLSFSRLSPCDLFDFGQENATMDPEVLEAFRKYYRNLENIGKHYGLKLFRNMILKNKGAFHFYSCKSHVPQMGERGGIATKVEQEAFECFPGTGYSILLPIIGRESGNYAVGADDQSEFREFCEQINAYSCRECEPYLFSGTYETQSEKEEAISQCLHYLSKEFGALQKVGCNIIYMDAGEYDELQAELLYKALIGQALEMRMPDVVFFNCSCRFVKGIQESAAVFFAKIGFQGIFEKNAFCIALYDAENVTETLIYPGSLESTYRANLMTVCTQEKNWLRIMEKQIKSPMPEMKYPRIPYDVLFGPGKRNSTIFEQYVESTLNRNIQGKEYGCKLERMHMRLGSTIHIATFYEAELLFGNRYFVSRFALMIALEIYRKFGNWNPEMKKDFQLTLCAYGMYSELLVFRTMEFLQYIYSEANESSMDYAILERELIADQIKHIDRFRYSIAFQSEEERKAHFKERKIISIVPINSTLKTQDKLLEIFCRENEILSTNFVLNFSLILVGPSESNQYWKLDESNRICIPLEKKAMVNPNPCYFIQIPISYYEANECELCYPDNPLLEKPLVEVNAYSTVPDQAIGMWNEKRLSLKEEKEKDTYFKIFEENDRELRKLYNSLVYSHIERNGNHFLYYFKTEKLFLEWKDDIRKWLEKKSELIENENLWSANSYHILFCPVHCSNTGFFEYVNKYAFHGAALVVRLDVNKEYRSNLKTKYSNLRLLIENMGQNSDEQYMVHAHFVDDCIITGKSFHRMQSLAQSLLSDCAEEYNNVNVIIFERVFVLIDRNSDASKQQYLCVLPGQRSGNREKELERRFFSYINLNISSMRNHGDSCNICQLEWESDGLARTSSTWPMMKYWKNRKKRFETRSVELYEEEQRRQAEVKTAKEITEVKDRNYRRMYCCHVAGTLLNEQYHGNQEKLVREGVLKLLLCDLEYRENNAEEQFEYFLSYLKILSRAFLVYQKSVREVIFPLLLILVQWQLGTENGKAPDIVDIAQAIWEKEKGGELFSLLEGIEKKMLPLLNTVQRKRDFLLVCMKQLMEMRSNYFIRKQNMKKLTAYISAWGQDRNIVYESYLKYVKKLTGVKSDTSKSAWLTEEIRKIMKEGVPEEYLPQDIMHQLLLENNRAYYDGIERLSGEQNLQSIEVMKKRIDTLRYQDFSRYLENNRDIKDETIWNSIRLIRYLRNEITPIPQTEEKTRKKYYDIAKLVCDILEAEKVYMLMATSLECEQWKYDFWKEMEKIHKILFPEEEYVKGTETEKKEYLVVSISGEHETVLEVPIPVVANIEKFETQKDGDYVDEEKGYFIWKLGMDEEHPIIIYVQFQPEYRNNLSYKCARFMIMNNLMNETAFSSSAIHYLYDIITAESNAIKLSYYKSFSHTPEDIRKQQYSDMVREGREKYFQSHVITLLSDLRVSENYRSGLKKDYYSGNLKVRYGKFFGERSIFHRIRDFYVVDGMTQEHIRINIHRKALVGEEGGQIIESDAVVPDDQKIAFKGYTNGIDDLLLLIMALIENAASKGKTEMGENGEKIVNVYLSRTEDGDLRIMNEVNKEGDLEKIRFFMSRPPQPKDGISIWSVSRYLLSLECSIIRDMINELKAGLEQKDVENTSQNQESIVNLYYKTEKLLDNLPETQVDYIKSGGKIYFSIILPVMAEKIRR